MIPFRLPPQPGVPLHEQVNHAAKRAILTGLLRPGDAFPSVRLLSKALKINPNTAHKAVAQLIAEGVLEVQPGIGTVVAQPPSATAKERSRILGRQLEQLIVDARSLGITLEEIQSAMSDHWNTLNGKEGS